MNAIGTNLLLSAAAGGVLYLIKLSLEIGLDLNSRTVDGNTAVMMTAYYGYADCMKYLIDQGAEINSLDYQSKFSALHYAAYKGHIECVKVLLEAGADRTHVDRANMSALDFAHQEGHWEIETLIRNAIENEGLGYMTRLFN